MLTWDQTIIKPQITKQNCLGYIYILYFILFNLFFFTMWRLDYAAVFNLTMIWYLMACACAWTHGGACAYTHGGVCSFGRVLVCSLFVVSRVCSLFVSRVYLFLLVCWFCSCVRWSCLRPHCCDICVCVVVVVGIGVVLARRPVVFLLPAVL